MFFFRKLNRKAIGVLAVVSASICLAVAAVWFVYSYHLTTTSLRTTGHITQLIERHGDRGNFYYPVFSYADSRGVQHTIRSNVGSSPVPYQVGDAVIVLYFSGSEANAHLDDWNLLWACPIVVGSVGAVYLAVGIVMLLWPRITHRRRRGAGG